jgi:hypothetical protein
MLPHAASAHGTTSARPARRVGAPPHIPPHIRYPQAYASGTPWRSGRDPNVPSPHPLLTRYSHVYSQGAVPSLSLLLLLLLLLCLHRILSQVWCPAILSQPSAMVPVCSPRAPVEDTGAEDLVSFPSCAAPPWSAGQAIGHTSTPYVCPRLDAMRPTRWKRLEGPHAYRVQAWEWW